MSKTNNLELVDAIDRHLNSAERHTYRGMDYRDVLLPIKCSDGTTLSVQASALHYCTPRSNDGPWIAVEVGYPSAAPPDDWEEYFDGDWENDDRCGSVYGHVPIGLVADYIAAHGGIAS